VWNLALSVAFVCLSMTFERYRRITHEHGRNLSMLGEFDITMAERINFLRGQFHQTISPTVPPDESIAPRTQRHSRPVKRSPQLRQPQSKPSSDHSSAL
jgi:hypothetical protein